MRVYSSYYKAADVINYAQRLHFIKNTKTNTDVMSSNGIVCDWLAELRDEYSMSLYCQMYS